MNQRRTARTCDTKPRSCILALKFVNYMLEIKCVRTTTLQKNLKIQLLTHSQARKYD